MPQPDNSSSSDILSVETLRRFRDGDAVAFQRVHQVFDRRLFAFLRSGFPGLSWQDAEDILQNLWLEILGSLQRFNPADGHRGFSGWVHKIVRLRAIDLIRLEPTHAAVTDPEQLTQQAVPGPSPEDLLQRKMELQQFRDCLQQLPPDWQRLITGKYIQEKSTAELATEEDLPENTVSTRLYRGKQQLQDCISHKQHPQTPPGQPLS
jgi:RNA polymerase sigma factor (sigma-70 family)